MRPMYSLAMNARRCGAVCHRKVVPVLKTLGKCSGLRAKPAHIPQGIYQQSAYISLNPPELYDEKSIEE